MEITSVWVRKNKNEESRMKAKVSVTLDDCFIIRDIRIVEGKNGLFIQMPSKRVNRTPKETEETEERVSNYVDIVHPINKETRTMFEDAIFEAYNNYKEE